MSHPELPAFEIRDMPELRFEPKITHIIPKMLRVPDDHQDEIELGENEYSQLLSFPTRDSYVINVHACLPTATHSWGSQLVGCHCKCRKYGFATNRLQSKGLYAVLTPTGEMMQVNGQDQPRLRHLLAQEVALMNGLPPSYVAPNKHSHLRLDLAATGQLASPLQSGWLLANIYHQLEQHGLARDTVHPRLMLANMCKALFQERDKIWDITTPNKYMEIFHKEINAIDRPIIFPRNDDQQDEEEIASQEIQKACVQAEFALAASDPKTCLTQNNKGKGGVIHSKISTRSMNAKNVETPKDEVALCQAPPYSNKGGIPGFESNKRDSDSSGPPEKKHCAETKKKERTDQMIIEQKHPTAQEFAIPPDMQIPAEDVKAKVCWVVHAEESMHQIRFQGQPTIGQLEQAEAYLNDDKTVFRSTTGVRTQDSNFQPCTRPTDDHLES